MGLAASQARMLMLTAWKSDLELRGQQINSQRLLLGAQTARAALTFSNALTNSQANAITVLYPGKKYSELTDEQKTKVDDKADDLEAAAEAENEATTTKLQAVDKILEMELKNIDTQHKAVDTEIDSVKKVIDKNIERSMKTFNA